MKKVRREQNAIRNTPLPPIELIHSIVPHNTTKTIVTTHTLDEHRRCGWPWQCELVAFGVPGLLERGDDVNHVLLRLAGHDETEGRRRAQSPENNANKTRKNPN
jgi:hypothetical protein